MQAVYLLMGSLLLIYALVNAGVLTFLFQLASPSISIRATFHTLFVRTLCASFILYGFFLLVARMFCWTATVAECLTCICPTITLDELYFQPSVAVALLFFVGITAVQAVIIPIAQGIQPGRFITFLLASNICAGLVRIGLAALFMNLIGEGL